MTAFSPRQHRTIIALLCLASALCISFALSSIPRQLGMSAAHAQAVGSGSAVIAPAIPDPTAAPLESLSLAEKLYHSGAYLCLGIVVLFVGLRWASSHVAWLEVPGRAHYVTAFLGGLALVALPASQGTTPNLSMIVVALGTVITLCAPGAASVPKAAQAGFARLGLMLAIALGFAGVIACDSCGGVTPVPVSDIIDCAKLEGGSDWPSIEQKLKPDFEAHNWSQLVSDAEALGPSVGLDIASCVAVELVQQYLSAKQVGGDTKDAHKAIDDLRAKLSAGGKSVTFHTSKLDL